MEWLNGFKYMNLSAYQSELEQVKKIKPKTDDDKKYVLVHFLSTRTAGKLYKDEMTVTDHQTLLAVLKRSKSQIVLSGYDNELYNAALSDWYQVSKRTTAQLGVSRTEKLYLNYIPPLGFV